MSEAPGIAQLQDVTGGISGVLVAALDGLGLGMVIVCDNGDEATGPVVQYMSPMAERITGRTMEAMRGHSALQMVAPESLDHVNELRATLLSGGQLPLPVDVTIVRASGERLPIEAGVAAMPADGAITIMVLVNDISERRRIAESLALADRMSTVGTVAAGVAHEIYNPLTAVLLNLDQAARALPSLGGDPVRTERLSRGLTDAREAAKRVRTIVQDLRAFTHMDEVEAKPVDICRVVRSTLNIVTPQIRGRAELQEDLAEVPDVIAHEGHLAQVFLNLMVNAAQAIPGAGDPAVHRVRIATRLDNRDRVVVEVSDTGGGMPQEVLRRAFDPFFTTKPIGVGIGLGLSICHNIITSLGGEIQAESMVGKGSVFRVYLPCESQ